MSVLIVESVPGLRRVLQGQLRDRGIEVTTAGSVTDAREQIGHRPFMVVIVDLVLPDGSGLDVVDALRSSGSAAHVIVTGDSTGNADRVAALDRGADDYMVRPFLEQQLTARVLAVSRLVDPGDDANLRVGAVSIDLTTREARVNDRLLHLSVKEFDLLAYFAARPGHTFSKAQLLRVVWRTDPSARPTTVATHIRRLRAQIEEDASRPRILRTVPGTGYRMAQPDQDDSTAVTGSGSAAGSLVHVQGRIVDADDATAALLGFGTAAELVGRRIFEFATASDMEPTRQRMTAPPSGPMARTQLIDLEHTDGTQTSVVVASERVVWQGDDAERLRFTHVPDASSRLRRLVTGVLGEVADAVIIADLHFHVRSWNKAAERLYGWKEEAAVGRHMLDVVRFEGDGGAIAATWQDLEVNGRWRGESRQVTRDGSVIEVLTSTTLLRDDDGAPVLIVSINRPTPPTTPARHVQETFDDEEIRIGLANDQFEVHYQPEVALADSTPLTMEALLRWNHPQRGLLTPDAFIAAAERSGAIVEMGAVVLEKACRQTAQWHRDGHDIGVAVNLSARQLADPGLVDRITTVLAASGLEPGCLWLEITETSLIEEVDRSGESLYRLADLGVNISIDDFGTGWASLTYLRSFPVHALKIDRTFVDGVGRNVNDTAIVRSILSLGADLGLLVVAEGIETVAQQKTLQKMGCTMGQGYLYGRPAPPSAEPFGERRSARPTPSAPAARRRSTDLHQGPRRPTIDAVRRMSTAQIVSEDP